MLLIFILSFLYTYLKLLIFFSSQSVDAWVSYVRTRESILAKHYGSDSLMLAGCVGEPRCRALLDTLLASLEPLKLLPFSLDLMFEMRELHRSFKKIESDMRAASRVSILHIFLDQHFNIYLWPLTIIINIFYNCFILK